MIGKGVVVVVGDGNRSGGGKRSDGGRKRSEVLFCAESVFGEEEGRMSSREQRNAGRGGPLLPPQRPASRAAAASFFNWRERTRRGDEEEGD